MHGRIVEIPEYFKLLPLAGTSYTHFGPYYVR